MQCEGQQFGGLHGTDIAAAKVLADYMGIPDVQTLRREPTAPHGVPDTAAATLLCSLLNSSS